MPDTRWKAIFEARGHLTDYIDTLWVARSSAPDELKPNYTERLASAAKLSTLLERLLSFETMRDLLHQENQSFPRDFLATDGGRNARSKFNLLSRYVLALEDYTSPDGSIGTGPEALVGEQLSSVAFVQDYVQLDFHGQGFSVSFPIIVEPTGAEIDPQSDGFRDRLCGIISKTVQAVRINDRAVIIEFSDCALQLVFADKTTSPEPLIFTSLDHRVQVF